MKSIIWNCQGSGAKSLPGLIRDMVHKYDISLISLLETRVNGERAVQRIKKMGFKASVRVDSEGFSGGIWVMWDPERVDVYIHSFSKQLIHCYVETLDGSYKAFTTFVYASPRQIERKNLWRDLGNIATSMDKPWCVMGDFNSYLYSDDKWGGGPPN